MEDAKMNISLIYNDKKTEIFRDCISLGLILIPIISALISIIKGYGG